MNNTTLFMTNGENNKVLLRIGCRMVLDEQGARSVHKHTFTVYRS